MTALRPLSFITFIISLIASPEKSLRPFDKPSVSWYASSTKRMPPRAALMCLAVLGAVWPTKPATRSPFCTSTTWSLAETPSCLYSFATSRETVVLPTPGLPVKIMCRIDSSVLCPCCRRRRSSDSSLHSLRMSFLTLSIPTSLPSSSSISCSAALSCSSVSGSGSGSSSSLTSSAASPPAPPPADCGLPARDLVVAARPFFRSSARFVYSMHLSRSVFSVTGFFSYLVAVSSHSAALTYFWMASSYRPALSSATASFAISIPLSRSSAMCACEVAIDAAPYYYYLRSISIDESFYSGPRSELDRLLGCD